MTQNVDVKKVGNIAILELLRPEALNALSKEIVDAIGEKIDEVSMDSEISVLMIRSEKNFAAGADIKEMAALTPEMALNFSFSKVFNKIEAMSIPTIAVIYGYALGGGLELSLSCDFRFVADTAKLGLPEITLGIFPGAGGTVRLSKLVGLSKAKEMIFTGKAVDGLTAEKIGLANYCFAESELWSEALSFSEKLSVKPRIALTKAKESMVFASKVTDTEIATNMEGALFSTLFVTDDQKEGMNAFIEKRKPHFTNK
jgi:enoyl-CoA hydratase/carnithine racemase